MSTVQLEKITIAGFPAHLSHGKGARPKLLFIHGAFVTHESFDPLQLELARHGWGGISFSRRGRLSLAPERAENVTIEDYIADTEKLISALDQKPILIAHSLGALIGQKILEKGLALGAVLLAPAPAGMLTAQPVALPSYLPMLPDIIAGKPFRPPQGTCGRIVLNTIPKEYHAMFHGSLVHESGKVYRQMMAGSVRVNSQKIKSPVLVQAGGQDRIVSVNLAKSVARKLAADFKLYQDSGHLLFADQGWESRAAEMADWLSSHFDSKSMAAHAA